MIEINGNLYSYSVKFQATARRRGISLSTVEETVQSPDEVENSEHDPQNRRVYRKLIGTRWISVIIDEREQMLITVWAD